MMEQLRKIFLVIVGSISLALGVLGIFLPLLPTTPFLLLSAACYVRSSEKLYQKLITNKYVGKYIQNYRSGKGIPLKTKIFAVTLLWISMGYTVIFVIPLIAVKVMLTMIGLFFTWVILKQKTLRQES
ncbi:YbaN family protein [Ornithinibacillus sp. 4-3]|uniref:YbaN family protein n=1 Tax=Ornithinibacillus sp. 4-3 TaxID=3231488 RepID=A0AB39HRV0_9BACI